MLGVAGQTFVPSSDVTSLYKNTFELLIIILAMLNTKSLSFRDMDMIIKLKFCS